MTAFRFLSNILATVLAGVAAGAWLCHYALPHSENHDPIWSGIGVGLIFAAAFFHVLAFPFGAQAMEGQPPWRHWSGLTSVLLGSLGFALFAVSLFLPPVAVTSWEWMYVSFATGAVGSMLKFPWGGSGASTSEDTLTNEGTPTNENAQTNDAPLLFHVAAFISALVMTAVVGERLEGASIQWAYVQLHGLALGAIVALLVAVGLISAIWKRMMKDPMVESLSAARHGAARVARTIRESSDSLRIVGKGGGALFSGGWVCVSAIVGATFLARARIK
jgi:hypothetical protein